MILVRSPSGRALFSIDGDVARDDAGKPLARPVVGADRASASLAAKAARWLCGRSANDLAPASARERVVTMDLGPGDVDTPSTQADFGLPNYGDCVADVVSPVMLVRKDRGVWYPENVADAVDLPSAAVSGDGSPPELNPGFSPANFTTVGYALAAKIPRKTMSNADFDLPARTTRFLCEALRRLREKRVAALLTTSANWAPSSVVAASAKWNLGTTPDPLADLFAGMSASMMGVTHVVMPERAAPFFFANAQSTASRVRDFVQAGGRLPEIVTAREKFLSAGVATYIWAPALPTNVALVRVGEPGSLSTSATFRWIGEGSPDGEYVEGVYVRQFFDSQTDSHWIVIAHNDAEVMVSNSVGALITGALQ